MNTATTPYRSRPNRQLGAGMLEVLVLLVVMSIGMLAMAKMQSVIMRDGGSANSRAVAVSLAQEKLDDLYNFKWTDTDNPPNTQGCGVGIFCFTEIANANGSSNTVGGGAELSSGVLKIPSGGVTIGNTAYTRTWISTPYWYCGNPPALSGSDCSPSKTPAFKVVTVTVTWTDPTGNQSVVLNGIIHSADTSIIAAGEGLNPAVGPKQYYTPLATPDAISIDIGGGKSTETTKPLPEVGTGGAQDKRQVYIEGAKYLSGTNELLSEDEFLTVNCTCTLQTSGGSGYTPYRMIWNNVTHELEVEKGKWETKQTGTVSGTGQSEYCVQCCRDHHDKDGYPSYTPFLHHTNDYTNQDHKHYQADGTTVATNGQDYIEACRLKSIQGVWRVVPDWRLLDVTSFSCDHFSNTSTLDCPPSAADNTSNLNDYRDHIRDVLVKFRAYLNDNENVDTTSDQLSPFDKTITYDGENDVSPILDKDESSDDVAVEYNGTRQTIARGLYADVIFKSKASGSPRAVDTDYVNYISDSTTYPSDNYSWLQHVPFYDVNLTLLANWSPTNDAGGTSNDGNCSTDTSGTDPVCVTNQEIDTIDDDATDYYDDQYSRGKLFGRLTSGSNIITTAIEYENTGLTDSTKIRPGDNAQLSSTLKAIIATVANSISVSGDVAFAGNGACNINNTDVAAVWTALQITYTVNSTTSSCSKQVQGNNRSYTCSGINANATDVVITYDPPVGYRVIAGSSSSLSSGDAVTRTIADPNNPGTTSITIYKWGCPP